MREHEDEWHDAGAVENFPQSTIHGEGLLGFTPHVCVASRPSV